MPVHTVTLPLLREERPDQAPIGLIDELRALPGVQDVTIEPVSGTACIRYDDARVSLAAVRRILAQHGYPTGPPLEGEGGQ